MPYKHTSDYLHKYFTYSTYVTTEDVGFTVGLAKMNFPIEPCCCLLMIPFLFTCGPLIVYGFEKLFRLNGNDVLFLVITTAY